MYKRLKETMAIVANEQRIKKGNYLFRKKEQQQLLMKMNKKQKKIVIFVANEQKIEKRSYLFRK